MNNNNQKIKKTNNQLEWCVPVSEKMIKEFNKNKIFIFIALLLLSVSLLMYGYYEKSLQVFCQITSLVVFIIGFFYIFFFYSLKDKRYLLNDEGVEIAIGAKKNKIKWNEIKSFDLAGDDNNQNYGDFWPMIFLEILVDFIENKFEIIKEGRIFYLHYAKGFSMYIKIYSTGEKAEQVQKFLEQKVKYKQN